jgi:hypothetical protein
MIRQITISEYEAEIKKQEGVVVTIRSDRPGTPSTVSSYLDQYKVAIKDDQTLRVLAERIKRTYAGIMFHMVMGDGRAAFTPRTKLKDIRQSYTVNKDLINPGARKVSNFSMTKSGAARTI